MKDSVAFSCSLTPPPHMKNTPADLSAQHLLELHILGISLSHDV